MNIRPLGVSRRTVTVAAALIGLVSLVLGANAALNKRTLEAASAATISPGAGDNKKAARIALVIGNGRYPDANAPLTQPINDARAMTSALRSDGFDVDVVEDATRDDMTRAIERMKAKVRPGSVVMLYFGGYGVQVGRESFLIPVDAAIWKEGDVRRDGFSIEAVMDGMKDRGAQAKLVVIDASRRNPYERRFRAFAHGLAPINVPENALILSSATPGKVADDSSGENSLLVSELLKNIGLNATGAEAVFTNTRIGVTRLTEGQQVPAVSSSLLDDVQFGSGVASASERLGG